MTEARWAERSSIVPSLDQQCCAPATDGWPSAEMVKGGSDRGREKG